MAIKGSGSSLSFSEIEAEFGANGSRALGAYRTSQNVGSLSNLPLDPNSDSISENDNELPEDLIVIIKYYPKRNRYRTLPY